MIAYNMSNIYNRFTGKFISFGSSKYINLEEELDDKEGKGLG